MYSAEVKALINEGSKAYSLRDYDLAASKYADACAAFNEEKEKDCPDLLLLYGKALFQSGVSKSGVLGGFSASNQISKNEEATAEEENFEEGMANEESEVAAEEEEEGVEAGAEDEEQEEIAHNNDDNINEQEEGAQEEEQSDFEASWDILDLARALFEERLSGLDQKADELAVPYLKSDQDIPTNEYLVNLKKLSETYDLLGEVSLESENFPQAAGDLESCLEIRKKLYDESVSSLVSESHYKLSLALEFCVEDPQLRAKAAQHMKNAIGIVEIRIKNESNETKKEDDAQLLQELEERHEELKKDPEEEIRNQQMHIIKGILGEATSEESGQAKLVSVVQSKVNDLSSMVKKRKAQPGGPGKKQKK